MDAGGFFESEFVAPEDLEPGLDEPGLDEPGLDEPGLSVDEVAAWAAAAPLGSGLLTPWGVLDPGSLSDAGRIDALIATQRLQAWADAQAQRLLAAMAPSDSPLDKGFVRDEIACALRLSPAHVSDRLHVAKELVHRLPATLALVESGAISLAHARFLAETLTPLDDQLATRIETRVLTRAPRQSLAAFRAAVNRAVLSIDPRTAEERHEQAVTERRVCARAVGDGMGELWALLPLDGLATIMTSLNAAASVVIPGDERNTDQRRADALIDLATTALGGTPTTSSAVGTWHGRRPTVQVTVAATTLAHADDQPGELDGYGPIPASLARAIAYDPTSTWRRLLTDPTGHLLDYGRTTYEPPQPLADHLIARDRHCRFPHCTRPARRCDIDHLHAWNLGGHTNTDNCECLCPRHHHLKHEAGWTLTGNPNGTLTWTTPTGHQYRSPPPTYP